MHKINILYVITKLELGGAQRQLLLLIRHIDKNRYNLFLITAKKGLLVDEALSIKELKVKTLKALEGPINPILDLFSWIEICNFIRKYKIDIVHTHSSKAGILGRWAARLAGANIITHTVHGWSFNDYQNSLLRQIFIFLERLTANITDRFIIVSNADKQRGLRNRIGKEKKYVLIRYGIDAKEFNKDLETAAKAREELGIQNSDLIVGMVACFKPQKAPLDYIRIVALIHRAHPKTKFILVGDGLLRPKIERAIEEFNLKDNMILTGWQRDIPKILSALDIFVLTSLWEGLPISVLEAMAASKPVVVTDTGGISEIIKHNWNGLLVKCCDIEAMKEGIITLLKDKELRYQMGRRASESLNSDFSTENMVRQTQNLYEDLIKEKEMLYAS